MLSELCSLGVFAASWGIFPSAAVSDPDRRDDPYWFFTRRFAIEFKSDLETSKEMRVQLLRKVVCHCRPFCLEKRPKWDSEFKEIPTRRGVES